MITPYRNSPDYYSPERVSYLPPLARRIVERRLALGMKQRDLAAASNMTNGSIGYYETGRVVPGAVAILGLCKALGMTPNELLGWEES